MLVPMSNLASKWAGDDSAQVLDGSRVPRTASHAAARPELVRTTVRPLAEIIDEGRMLEHCGHRVEARHVYETALHDGGITDPASLAQLHRLIARTYMQESEHDSADLWARLALSISDAADDPAGYGHAMNMLASICWTKGELDEAERLYTIAQDSAQRSGDARLSAMTDTNLGNIATVRGNHAEALAFHESALKTARHAGLGPEVMFALNNLGLLHTQMARFEAAERSYREALRIARELGDLSACSLALVNVARLRLRQDDHEGARVSCDEASKLAHEIGDASTEGEAAQIYGIIERARGNSAVAEGHFLRAERVAHSRGDLILQGETARELAVLYRQQDRNRQTLQKLNQAHRLFGQLRARNELADIDRQTARLESDFVEVARRWGESIESQDHYTQGHCERVADLSCALWARVSNADQASLFWFRIGALLHDVGKLMVPAEVLNKPGRLDAEEWALIRRHPSAGVELLADIEFPWDVRPIVESHHERWDGKGYPHGIGGEEIPLTARVLCVADVYDALTSVRSYKKALSHTDAMAIMAADAGTAFDPDVFAAFAELHSH